MQHGRGALHRTLTSRRTTPVLPILSRTRDGDRVDPGVGVAVAERLRAVRATAVAEADC